MEAASSPEGMDSVPLTIHSPKLTFSPLKIDGWKMIFLSGWPIFRGYVSFREGSYCCTKKLTCLASWVMTSCNLHPQLLHK